MNLHNCEFIFKNQYTVKVSAYSCDNNQTTAIFLPAIGVAIKKYERFIERLTASGCNVICADYPCCGDNQPMLDKNVHYDYSDLVHEFIPELVRLCKSQHIVLIGHSLGGHIACLYSTGSPIPVIGIATGNIHYKNWSGFARYKIIFFAVVVKLLTRMYGYFPGYKLGFGNRESAGIMQNWCHTVFTGNYDYFQKNLTQSKEMACFVNIANDHFAPLLSAQNLANLFKQSIIETIKPPSGIAGNPHSNWIKQPHDVLEKISAFFKIMQLDHPISKI